MFTITNMATVRNFEDLADKFKIVGIHTCGSCTEMDH